MSSQEKDLLLGQQTQMLSQRYLGDSTHIPGPEKPQRWQKPLKSPNLPTDTTRAGCTPCPTKAACSQALLFPTKGCTQRPPGTHPAPSPACQFQYRLPRHRKIKRVSVNAPENKQKNCILTGRSGGQGGNKIPTKALTPHSMTGKTWFCINCGY